MAGVLGDRQPPFHCLHVHLAAAAGEPLDDPHRLGKVAGAAPDGEAVADILIGDEEHMLGRHGDAVDLPHPFDRLIDDLLVGHVLPRLDMRLHALARLLVELDHLLRLIAGIAFLLSLELRDHLFLHLRALLVALDLGGVARLYLFDKLLASFR